MQKADYALLILSYNHPELTQKTVQSVLDLQFKPAQIFLTHNGSNPSFVDHLKNLFPNIQHLIQLQNKGFTGGANFGLQEVFKSYDCVFFLTNDTEAISLPEIFPKKIDLLAPLILKRKTDQIDSVFGVVDLKKGKLKHLKQASDFSTLQSCESLYVPGTAFGLQKECFEKVGGFDESFHTYWEDVDFSLKAQNLGFKIDFSDLFKLRHKIGKTCHKDRFYTLYLFQRNRRRLMSQYQKLNLKFLTLYLFDMLKILGRILLKPKRKEPLKLWWKALYD